MPLDFGCAFVPWSDPHYADAEGIVGFGGRLDPLLMLQAYSEGVFPWYNEGDPIMWWSPDPRAVFEYDTFHVSRRLLRTIRQGKFEITINHAFSDVINGCARRDEGTWITPEMFRVYMQLHEMGYAHSVESWKSGRLAGGVFGLSIGGLFCADSMFFNITDGSKVAVTALMQRLQERGYEVIDIQMPTEHTLTLGATEIPREEYLDRIERAVEKEVAFVD